MHMTKRLSLVLSPMEKTVIEQLAKTEGELSQSALVRQFIKDAAHPPGVWPSDKQHRITQPVQEAQRA